MVMSGIDLCIIEDISFIQIYNHVKHMNFEAVLLKYRLYFANKSWKNPYDLEMIKLSWWNWDELIKLN